MEVGGYRSHSEFFLGKSSQNTPKPPLPPGSSQPSLPPGLSKPPLPPGAGPSQSGTVQPLPL